MKYKYLNNTAALFKDKLQHEISKYNLTRGVTSSNQVVGCSAIDQDETLVGGIYGWIEWGWLFINLLWVDDTLRGQGIGSRLISELEEKAIQGNIYNVHLETASFQSPDFYINRGYQVVLQMPIMSDNGMQHIKYTMHKRLK